MRRAMAGTAIAVALIGCPAVSAQAATPHWRVAQTNPLPGDDGILQIAVTPGGGSWATGYQTVNGQEGPLVQHLTSKGWKTITSPSSALGRLAAVTASSNEDVWAFGGFNPSRAAHWNGKRWTITTIAQDFTVEHAVALSPSNVWAVDGGKGVAHWNGRTWIGSAIPATADAIGAVSAKSLWAAGSNGRQPAVMHRTGSSWKLLKIPTFKVPDPNAYPELDDLVAFSDKNVWAVGGYIWPCGQDYDSQCSRPLTLHWNGHTWSRTEAAQAENGYMNATPDGNGGLWLLEGRWDPTLIHEVKGRLTAVPAPRPTGHDVIINDIANKGRTIWAGGASFLHNDPSDPLGDAVYLRNG
jgi:hypothetical protein